MLFRKAQAELLGFVVMVFLLIFLGFLYVRFSSLDSGNSYSTLRMNIETHNLLESVLALRLEGSSVRDMTVTCALDEELCAGLQTLMKEAFDSVLEEGYTYQFTLVANDNTLFTLGSCAQGLVASFPYVKDGIFFETMLRLCPRSTV